MDWYPLFNSIRIAFFSTCITFFMGVLAAWYISKASRGLKGFLDCVLTIPMVLPPTVVGFFLLKLLGPNSPLGGWILEVWGAKIIMTWYAAIAATTVVTFPLMYRTARGAFEGFERSYIYAGQTLGLSNPYIFWRIVMPGCRQGILAGVVLAFARGLGEYGATSMVAGYTPGRTATISTTVYQLWRENNDAMAYRWVAINLIISFLVLLVVNLMEKRTKAKPGRAAGREG